MDKFGWQAAEKRRGMVIGFAVPRPVDWAGLGRYTMCLHSFAIALSSRRWTASSGEHSKRSGLIRSTETSNGLGSSRSSLHSAARQLKARAHLSRLNMRVVAQPSTAPTRATKRSDTESKQCVSSCNAWESNHEQCNDLPWLHSEHDL